MTIGSPHTLIDRRDGQSYKVAKLADNRVWIISNLNLGDTDNYPLRVDKLDYTNTNLPNDETKEIATSANTYCIEGASSAGNATADLCPAGWRLPTGGGSDEFMSMATEYGYTGENTSNENFRKSLANGGTAFGLAGFFGNSRPVYQGSSGSYWSSAWGNSYSMHDFYLTVSDVTPDSGSYRYYGFPIRCTLK